GAGAAAETIVTTKVRGAHPGGTAAIGEVVDKNLQTKIKNLYVADASVLPKSPGLPPIVTIVALAKRLAKRIK
ncbi:MAG: GMC oxidoreductase, partial [Candidatus Pacebacteria bacterium]|nr:GMC oxidoreductase [Candidatus Paceibacterota bacterium]